MSTIRTTLATLCALASLSVATGAGAGSPASGAAPAAPAAAAEAPVSGVWVENKVSFTHLGFTATYSCDGLADKLKRLLILSGARADAKAYGIGCNAGRPTRLARADLTFYTLQPAESAPPPAAGAAPQAPVPGVYKPVRFTGRTRDLGEGDCELVEEFKNVLLPKFSTRAVDARFTCVPHQLSNGGINLSFESLTAVPAPNAAPGKTAG